MPDNYDGSDLWLDFIKHCETVDQLKSWDGEELAEFVAVSLRERAREIYTDLPLECRRVFQQLTLPLAEGFGRDGRPELHLTELRESTR